MDEKYMTLISGDGIYAKMFPIKSIKMFSHDHIFIFGIDDTNYFKISNEFFKLCCLPKQFYNHEHGDIYGQ